MIKRGFDILFAVSGLVVTWPLWMLAVALIKLESKGPVFFKQVRIGRGFQPFSIYKFRTMVTNASSLGGPITIAQDPRVTKVGTFLRRTKLDELPQLLNILKGDMSVVGPRPEVPLYVELFRADYADILHVRPGLTDLASLKYIDEASQLAGAEQPEVEYRTTILPEKIRLARLYVERASILLDVAIIAQTCLRLFGIPWIVCELPELQTLNDPRIPLRRWAGSSPRYWNGVVRSSWDWTSFSSFWRTTSRFGFGSMEISPRTSRRGLSPRCLGSSPFEARCSSCFA